MYTFIESAKFSSLECAFAFTNSYGRIPLFPSIEKNIIFPVRQINSLDISGSDISVMNYRAIFLYDKDLVSAV